MSTKKKIVVIHHQPLEIFPPVQNFLNYLAQRSDSQYEIVAISTSTSLPFKKFECSSAIIKRVYSVAKKGGPFRNVTNFGVFTLKSLFHLIQKKPCAVIYFESHSALPVYLFFKFFRSKAKLFIHYHEYMTKKEYGQKGMRLVNFSHKRESALLYKIANWISHTNDERMRLFLLDNPGINNAVSRIIPNYPPRSWSRLGREQTNVSSPVGLVYVGSFGSLEDLYIREIVDWAAGMKGQIFLDIYSFNISTEVESYVKRLSAENIRIQGTVEYSNLPVILSRYDIGLILYKGTSLNFTYNAPNKLFEYLALGLDVWFPKEMLGSYPYIRTDVYPKVIDVDFTRLADVDLESMVSRKSIPPSRTNYFCEDVYSPLVDKIHEC